MQKQSTLLMRFTERVTNYSRTSTGQTSTDWREDEDYEEQIHNKIAYLLMREYFYSHALCLLRWTFPAWKSLAEGNNIRLKSLSNSNHVFRTLKWLKARYFFLLLVLGFSMTFNSLCLRQPQNGMQVNSLNSSESYGTQTTCKWVLPICLNSTLQN